MFEQTIVSGGETRPWTYFVSASGQMLVGSIFVVVPLIYTDSIGLRAAAPPPVVFRPLAEPPRIEQRETAAAPSSAARVPRLFDRVFRAPDHIPPSTPTIVDEPGPAIASDPHARAPIGNPDGVSGSMLTGTAPPPAYKKDPVVEKAAPPKEPIRVASTIQAAKIIKKVVPLYPILAKQARVSGTVRLLGVVAKDGTIQKLQLLSGHPLLTGAALEAVRQWVYQPTLLNGEAVEVMAPIDVIFTLSQ